jgi:hypothetical protein
MGPSRNQSHSLLLKEEWLPNQMHARREAGSKKLGFECDRHARCGTLHFGIGGFFLNL